MAGRFKPQINHNSEFELDLAPLLAVMVKLVPVLLVSSACVQLMIVETELPQVVQQAIERQAQQTKPTVISLNFGNKEGVRIVAMESNGQEKVVDVDLNADRTFDFEKIHGKLIEVKKNYPDVFKIEFNPDADVSYKDIVRMMDEARKVRSSDVRFKIKNENTGEVSDTDYMFPEVTFANMSEG